MSSFLSLEDEGHDTTLIRKDLLTFGKIHMHITHLLRLLEIHLPRKTAESRVIFNRMTRPHTLIAESVHLADNPIKMREGAVYTVRVTWEAETVWRICQEYGHFRIIANSLVAENPHLPYEIPQFEGKFYGRNKVVRFFQVQSLLLLHLFDYLNPVCVLAR
jgi:hypothetical protein